MAKKISLNRSNFFSGCFLSNSLKKICSNVSEIVQNIVKMYSNSFYISPNVSEIVEMLKFGRITELKMKYSPSNFR